MQALNRRNTLALILTIIAVAGLATPTFMISRENGDHNNSAKTFSPPPVHRTFWLNASVAGWNKTRPGPTIIVNSGDAVSLMLTSVDFELHQWFIDANNNSGLDPGEIFASPGFYQPSMTVNYTFTPVIGVNVTRPGNWEYRCTYHPLYMYGIIIINQPPDFTITPSPSLLSPLKGQVATSTITLQSLGKFTGTLELSTITNSPILSASLNTTTVNLSENGLAHIQLSVTGTAGGHFQVNITATGGQISHTSTVTVAVGIQDYDIHTSPASTTILATTTTNATITVNTTNQLTATINLTATTTPTSTGMTLDFSPARLNLTPSSTQTSTLTITTTKFTQAQQYTITIQATNGTLSHSTTFTLTVTGDFVLYATITSTASITTGHSATSTITTNSLGYDGNIALSTTISPAAAGMTFTFSPTSISLTPGSTATSTLTITATDTTPPGVYYVTIVGTSGTQSHAGQVSIIVSAPVSSAPSLPLVPTLVIGATATILVVTGLVIFSILNRRRRSA